MSERAVDFADAAAAMSRAERIVVTGHIRPDGDALGSMLGLAISARGAGKTAFATFGEPFVVPKAMAFLDQTWLVAPNTEVGHVDLLVACDTASPDRLGSVASLAAEADSVLVIDHHVSNEGFGDVRLIDPEAAATAQLAHGLLVELGWDISPATAAALYTGLVTDTGRFQYSNTTPEVLRIAGALIEAGAVPDEIGMHLYERSPFGYLAVAGLVMTRARLEPEKSLVWSLLKDEDLRSAEIGPEDADALIDLIRIAEEAHVAVLLKEPEPGVIKASLRSRGRVDVAAIASRFGGGGHHNASGFTIEAAPEQVMDLIREQL